MVNSDAGRLLPDTKPIIALVSVVLALSIGSTVWLYTDSTRKLWAQGVSLASPKSAEPAAGLLRNANVSMLKTTGLAVLCGAGLMAFMIVGIGWWRKRWVRRIEEKQQQWEEASLQLEKINNQVQRHLADERKLQEELDKIRREMDARVEQRTADLSKKHAQLEAELNERKQAEKALAQQAQELGRSKDVLELHVQARTQELQKLKGRYEHILNSAGEGIYGLDMQGRATFVNPAAAKITGWKVEELIGKSEQEVFHHITAQTGGNTAVIQKGNEHHLTDQMFYRKDGSSFIAEYVRSPIIENGKQMGAVVIFKDITERKRTEEALARKAAELARSNAELEQFAYVASHDLQEPLRKIQAFGDRLKGRLDGVQSQEARDYLERMQSAAARMQRLINDLLSFSRVISTTQPFVPVDLGVVTKEVLTDLEVRIEQTKAKIEVGELPTIDADPMQMRQLLQNLIGNALKFQSPTNQPVIKVFAERIKSPFAGAGEAAPNDEVCKLTIQDNGIGFDEKYSEKIFAMFQRLHGRSEYEGTGVGLAICRRITDRHGGMISATGKLGEGATFVVTLPIQHTNKTQSPQSHEPSH